MREPQLVLGTAQFGMQYGIANLTSQPDLLTAEAIIETAWSGGIQEFDTAQAYGTSEEVLGKTLQKTNLSDRARITTKLTPEVDHRSIKAVFDFVEKSLNRLGVSKIHCLMLHREQLLQQWHDGISQTMKELIDSRVVGSVGISVYSPNAALRALNTDGITAIQIPSNVFDRRFEKAGIFNEDFPIDKQIYIRSIFLQGLLFLNPDDLPSNMMFAYQTLNKYESLVKKHNTSKLELALGYVKEAYPKANIIVGAETSHQVNECLSAWQFVLPDNILKDVRELFMDVDERILNPGLWPH